MGTDVEAVAYAAEVLDPTDPITKTIHVYQQTSKHLITNHFS